jgi:hypothetical protein
MQQLNRPLGAFFSPVALILLSRPSQFTKVFHSRILNHLSMNEYGTLWSRGSLFAILHSMRDRAMELLGSNMTPSMTASILGCSEGLISQYMGEEEFATEVTKRRLKTLQATIQRDNKYDNAEDALLDKLKDLIPSMFDPLKILQSNSSNQWC